MSLTGKAYRPPRVRERLQTYFLGSWEMHTRHAGIPPRRINAIPAAAHQPLFAGAVHTQEDIMRL